VTDLYYDVPSGVVRLVTSGGIVAAEAER